MLLSEDGDMEVIGVVRPSNMTMEHYPFMEVLSQAGLPNNVLWSQTRNGPHYKFDFSDLANDKLQIFKSPDLGTRIQIGRYTRKGPFATVVYLVLVCPESRGVFLVLEKTEEIQPTPILLASSIAQLADLIDAFISFRRSLTTLKSKEDPKPIWERFENACREIDHDGFKHDFSFFGNMIAEAR
jgi:hypothetical protein